MTAGLAAGSTFAGYRIESVIGRGGMGVVYRATDLSLERPVALKLIAPELADDQRFRQRFFEEPRLAASLDHSSVIPIYEAGERDGQLYLAMRYVPGSDLRTLLEREGRLAPDRALAILAQIAGALDAAHRRGLVHRDVKPANVLLDEDEHAYLSDFGITQPMGADAADSAGTLDYLAPEQIRGEPVDGHSDGYALACVLYECLAGTPPFRRQTPAETLWAHLREEPAPLEAYPALDPVLRRALAQDRDERYPTCSDLIEAAREAFVPRLARRRRAILAAGAVVLAAATAAAIFATTRDEEGAAAKAPTGNGIATIGPAGDRLGEFITTPPTPSNIAVGEGAVWLLNAENRTISRVDPKTKAVTGTIPAQGAPTDLSAGADAVWLGSGGGEGGKWTQTVWRLDPRTGAVTGLADLPGRTGERAAVNGGFTQIAVGAGAVWATGGGAVTRIDARTGAAVATVDAYANRIAAGREGVWFISVHDAGAVTRIDPRRNRAREPLRVGDATLTGIAVGGGSVWVTSEQAGVLWRIAPDGRTAARPILVGQGAAYVAYGAGGVWIANYLDGTVTRVDPRTNEVGAKVPVGAVQALAAGAGSAWVSTVGATRAGALPASTCGDLVTGGQEPNVVIASDLSLQAADFGGGPRAMADAIRVVLEQHGFRAGRYAVGYRSCDDSTAQAGAYEPRRCAANANAYAGADRLVAVIGPRESGCAQVEIPILNRAPGGPLAMISPTNQDAGLTREGPPPPFGYRGTPEVFYPIGVRHYVRLTPPDSIQGPAHAALAKELGLKRVYVLDDGIGYEKAILADPFRQAARRLGVTIAGSATFDPDAKRYDDVVERVARSRAQGVVLAGDPWRGALRLLKALRSRLGQDVPIMGGYKFASSMTSAELFEQAGPGVRGLYVTTFDVPRTERPLSAAGRRIARSVDAEQPGVLEAAQATELVLGAIARSDGTRASVLEQLRAGGEKDGILGTFRFDDEGDMTPGRISIVRITRPVDGYPVNLEGAVLARVMNVPPSWAD
jgi:ABC-type branched-subunit amino acid transport system substrate-binding protein